MPSPPPTPRHEAARAIAVAQDLVHPDDDWRYELPPETVRSLEEQADAVLAVLATHIRQLRRVNVRSDVDPEFVQRAFVALDDVLALLGDTTPQDEAAWGEAWRPQVLELMEYLQANGWAGGLTLKQAVEALAAGKRP